MWAIIALVVVAGLAGYAVWLAVELASQKGALERDLDNVKAQLAAERKRAHEAVDAERTVRDAIDAGKLYDDDGFRRE